jgi:hypothetical protein
MDVAALKEIQWKGKGSIRNVKFAVHYSGNDRQGNRGVGFIVSKKARNRYWDFYSFLKRYVSYELKVNSITSHSLIYMHLQKIMRMKQ